MRSRILAAAATVGIALFLTPPAVFAAGFPIDETRGGIPTIAPVLEKVTPGVVNIATSATVRMQPGPLLRDPFFRQFFPVNPRQLQRLQQSAGSGVIVDAARGYILTNHHVVEGADRITVTLADQRQLDAKLIGTDAATDVAVLQVDANDLTAVPLGDSGRLKVGDFVLAVGNPFGLGQTVTSGIISAVGRGGINMEGYEDFIQTDAAINPGNSGGALIDLNGRLIGINTQIISPTGGNIGIGFAVPISMTKAVMDQLIEFGEVRRGRLGVDIADLNQALARELGITRTNGVVVMGVEPGSSADRAGLRRGDVILGINGAETRTARELRNRIGMMRPGETLEIAYSRGGRNQAARVELRAREEQAERL